MHRPDGKLSGAQSLVPNQLHILILLHMQMKRFQRFPNKKTTMRKKRRRKKNCCMSLTLGTVVGSVCACFKLRDVSNFLISLAPVIFMGIFSLRRWQEQAFLAPYLFSAQKLTSDSIAWGSYSLLPFSQKPGKCVR